MGEKTASTTPLTRFLSVVTAAFLAALLLVGCGQKGDLYLPEEDEQSKKRD